MTSFAAKLAAKRDAKKGNGAPAMTAPKLAPSTPSKEQKETAPSETSAPRAHADAPPWAHEGCPACKGCGFNSKGSACAICQHKTGTPVTGFDLDANDDGTVTWISKTDPDVCGVSPLPGQQAPPKATERDAAVTPEKGGEVEPEKPKRQRRSRKTDEPIAVNGLILCINCGPHKPAANVVWLAELLEDLGKQMAAEMDGKVESFYDIDAFDRRDALRKAGEQIAESLSGKTVVAEGVGTGQCDIRALVDAIRPFAATVFYPNAI